jgi:hypothetical protein
MSSQELRTDSLVATMREVDRSFAIALVTLGVIGLFITALAFGGWALGSMPGELLLAFAAVSALGLLVGWWHWRRSRRPGGHPVRSWHGRLVLAAMLVLTGERVRRRWGSDDVLQWLDLTVLLLILLQAGFAARKLVRRRRPTEAEK